MVNFTSDQWVILALIFTLGLLIGAFLTAGGRRKWKRRYRDEVSRREALEQDLRAREREWDERESEWRERESLRDAADRDRRPGPGRDSDSDGVPDRADDRPLDDRKA